jgi:hypothetical protein
MESKPAIQQSDSVERRTSPIRRQLNCAQPADERKTVDVSVQSLTTVDPFAHVVFKVYTEITDDNLITPIDASVWGIYLKMRQSRLALAGRALLALYYEICRSGCLEGKIPVSLMADWLWGPDAKPKHWRSQMKGALDRVIQATFSETQTIFLTLDRTAVAYAAAPIFLGCLSSMVKNFQLRLCRSVTVKRKITRHDINSLRQRGGYSGESDAEMRQRIKDRAKAIKNATLSTFGRQSQIRATFMPAVLGVPSVCKALGQVAIALAANVTRNYRVENAIIQSFSNKRGTSCNLLDRNIAYNAFAANGRSGRKSDPKRIDRAGRGYLLSRWLDFHGMKSTDEKKLFHLWASAAKPLMLTVVGVNRTNKLYSLEDMQAASPAVLETLHVRVYTPIGWQRAWTEVFGMKLGGTAATDARRPRRTSSFIGDLPEIASLVRENGVRKTAGDLNLDFGNLSRYINGRRGFSPAHAAILRRYLYEAQPVGGPEILTAFGELIDEHPGNLGWALAYRRLMHWSVVPLMPGTRQGYIKWLPYQTILPSEDEIFLWWGQRYTDASIGLVLGPLSGVFAIDVDNAAAEDALINLLSEIPDCPTQQSGSYSADQPWKKHYVFRHPIDLRTGARWEPLAKGLEFRGNRGLLVLAPSVHKSGNGEYGWEEGHAIWQQELPPLPTPLLKLLVDRNNRKDQEQVPHHRNPAAALESGLPRIGFNRRSFSVRTREFLGGHVNVGERNDRLFAAAREMRDYGVLVELAKTKLVPAAQALGLGDEEINATIASAYSRTTTPRR